MSLGNSYITHIVIICIRHTNQNDSDEGISYVYCIYIYIYLGRSPNVYICRWVVLQITV